jgi:hypothetical protein
MAGYKALAAAGRSIRELLRQRIAEELGDGRKPTPVLVGTTDLGRVGKAGALAFPVLSIYCYRLSIDRHTRAGLAAAAGVDGVPRLPLQMHLLISAWDDHVEFELEWLGLAVRILESEPILTGPYLDGSGEWERGDALQVSPDELALDSISEAFQALTADFRLCLPYVVRTVRIGGRPVEAPGRVGSVRAGLVQPVVP